MSKDARKSAHDYLYGRGIVKNIRKALEILIDGALENDLDMINDLSDFYFIGYGGVKDLKKAQYFQALAAGKKPKNIYLFENDTPINFAKNKATTNARKEEQTYLDKVNGSFNDQISNLKSGLNWLDDDTSWMDHDQRSEWVDKRHENSEKYREIAICENMKTRPYYARMDTKADWGVQSYYIGEEQYSDFFSGELLVISVWSPVGRYYRAKTETHFCVKNEFHQVLRRRQIDIKDGVLIDFFDEYDISSKVSQCNITDPFLLKVLQEKKGEVHITNIIRSIQTNQNNIIDHDFSENFIVQGCAGSGKTMILLHRLANMKFNRENLNLSRIKIITPNENFSMFIDDISKNLGLERIERLSISEYYIKLLLRYYGQFGSEGRKELKERALTERANILIAVEIPHQVQEYIYSDEFESKIVIAVKTQKEKEKNEIENAKKMMAGKATRETTDREKIQRETPAEKEKREKEEKERTRKEKAAEKILQRKDFKKSVSEIEKVFDSVFHDIIKNISICNHKCVLYAKVLFMLHFYGEIYETDDLLCIDEGQDLAINEYRLIKTINKNPCFNIYGDLNQQLPFTASIGDWEEAKSLLAAKVFVLNENYRNSDNIIKFYNKRLYMHDNSFGLRAKEVRIISEDDIDMLLKLSILLGTRASLISNDKSKLVSYASKHTVFGRVEKNKISLLTVKEAKGLEFDVTIAFESELSKNERYIAFTRPLSELYVVC